MPDGLAAIAGMAPSIAMLGCFACIAGGAWMIAKRRDRTKGVLLIVMAVVLFGNVLIWVA